MTNLLHNTSHIDPLLLENASEVSAAFSAIAHLAEIGCLYVDSCLYKTVVGCKVGVLMSNVLLFVIVT